MKNLIISATLLFFFQVWCPTLVVAHEKITKESFQDSVLYQLSLFPQEKIHVHTDRTMYVSGEKIWFKAYVVDAFTHQLPTYSNYAYIELINSSDSLVQRVMVKCDDNGLFYGNIFLSEFIPEGWYMLRAYTRYMENQGSDYFFRKHIWIGSIRDKEKQKIKKPGTNYEVSFFPEGGNFPEGINSWVAFKALNEQGGSENITGKIMDKEGNEIVEVNTVFAGMGSFIFSPEPGEEYFLICQNGSGREKRFKLPHAQKTYTLQTSSMNNRHFIAVKKSPGMPERPLYLLVHNKGLILHFGVYDYRKDYIGFLNTGLPLGIIQVLLLDEQMNPVSERLFFNKNEEDQARLAFSPDKPYYEMRERVTSEISVTDTEGNPIISHVSIAVTDDRDAVPDTLRTILSSLLLSSELRGHIESPGYYLQNDKKAEMALDHLMMTHGWRRYDLPEAFKGNYQRPETGYEKKGITGSVTSLLLKKPVANCEVMCLSSEGYYGLTKTDSAGWFRFDLDYPDSTRFSLQAMNKKGNSAYEVIYKQEQFPKLNYIPVSLTTNDTSVFMKKAGQRAQYDGDMRIINLPEVVITGTQVAKRDEIRLQYWQNWGSDKTIYREEFENRFVSKWQDLLVGRVAGITVYGPDRRISIRGYGPPLVLVNGLEIKELEVSPEEIESIDIFKGPSAAQFGTKGSNGAINITTRRGRENYSSVPPNYVHISPIGFQKPVNFYSPQYDTPESKNLEIPDYRTTIFWKPELAVPDTGKASFDFYTADFPATYSIVIEGISNDGRIIRKVEKIKVR